MKDEHTEDQVASHVSAIKSSFEALVIFGEAVGKDINPTQEDHEHAAHKTAEEHDIDNVR
jgi:hypothetical protein